MKRVWIERRENVIVIRPVAVFLVIGRLEMTR